MSLIALLLGYASAVLLENGMRDASVPPGIPEGSATYKIDPATRKQCVTSFAMTSIRTNQLKNGAPCSSIKTQSDCAIAFEGKSRHDHVWDKRDTEGNGHSLVGEIHLCEWHETMYDHECEAGEALTVCPEDDVIQVTKGGDKAGDQKETKLLPAEGGLPSAMMPALVEKAQGRCAEEAFICPDGESVSRDPELSCRFAACAGQTSLVEASNTQPTYQWTGVSIADNQNFCKQMTGELGSYEDMEVQDCAALGNDVCEKHHKHINDGNVGDIAHCEKVGTTGCKQGAVHNCTWSFYMEELMDMHKNEEKNCAAKLLESRRSLDGLLHSVQDVYNQLMQWNAIVQAENGTIRNLLDSQVRIWDGYVVEQAKCETEYQEKRKGGSVIGKEMEELRAIANPISRSAVDFNGQGGYQTRAETKVHDFKDRGGENDRLPTAFLEIDESAQYDEKTCEAFSSLVQKVEANHGLQLLGKVSPRGPCDNTKYFMSTSYEQKEYQTDNWGDMRRLCYDEYISKGQYGGWAQRYANGKGWCARFKQEPTQNEWDSAGASADCADDATSGHCGAVCGTKFQGGAEDCHEKRAQLQEDFREGFLTLGKLYNDLIGEVEIQRTICLNLATYTYKSQVEGIEGIDDKIQDSAGKIHEAQGEIAKLEPMLHDVERAVDRMRNYTTMVTTECGDEQYLGNIYTDIKNKIIELQECPGRNDFYITVPHWTPTSATDVPTPNPTPWYADPKNDNDRPKL